MNFTTAVRTCIKKYATFSGLASRSEYWYFVLFLAIGNIVFSFHVLLPVRVLWTLAFLVPDLAVAVRRLHDTGRSAWWLLTGLIPPWLIILFCLPSKMANNRYEADRVAFATSSITEESLTSTSAHCSTCGKLRLPGQTYCVGCGAKFAED
jgi:uncharacterized membrane protein YhaH (DUF805 family)